MKALGEALLIVLVVSFLSIGWRSGLVDRDHHSAGARRHLRHHVRDRHRPAAHFARRADHRARPARRRRDDRRRDDGAQARGRAGQDRRGELRLYLDRLPDADRHADHHRRLHPGRLRGFDGRRICALAVLRRRHRAGRLLVRGGLFHAVARPHDPQAAQACRRAITMSSIRASIAGLRATVGWAVRHRIIVLAHDAGDLRRQPVGASSSFRRTSSRSPRGRKSSSISGCRKAPASRKSRRRPRRSKPG